MPVHRDLRNVVIVARVDHSKTTSVDAMLWQSGILPRRGTVERTGERVMGFGNLEREKGITILAKNTAVHYSGPVAKVLGLGGGATVNATGIPEHADFGDEVERGLFTADGVIPVVDAPGGPLS